MKIRFLKPSVVIGACLFVSACTFNTPLLSEADKVKILTTRNAKACKFMGKIWAFDVNGSSQAYQSKEHLHQDGLNKLKNQTIERGANAFYITNHQVSYRGDPKKNDVDEHRFNAEAYLCK